MQPAETLLQAVGVVVEGCRRSPARPRFDVGPLEQLLHLGAARHRFVVPAQLEQGA